MLLINNTVAKKVVMAVTGAMLTAFTLIHRLGNSSVFIGPEGINAYAMSLQSLGPLVWVFRLSLLTVFVLHVLFGILLTLENRAGRPQKYAVTRHLRGTLAGRAMIWTGLFFGGFIVLHLLHFTFHVVTPELSQDPGVLVDGQDRRVTLEPAQDGAERLLTGDLVDDLCAM